MGQCDKDNPIWINQSIVQFNIRNKNGVQWVLFKQLGPQNSERFVAEALW